MTAVRALAYLSIVLALWVPKIASAQAPARQAPAVQPNQPAAKQAPAPVGAAPSAPAEAARPAPVSAEPETTTASYGDWLLRCQRVAAATPSQRVCGVLQTVQAQGQQNPILQISIAPAAGKEPMKLTILAPVNVSFPSVARVGVDEKDAQAAELTWHRCVPAGCVAESELKDELLKRWRAQTGGGVVQIVDSIGHDVGIPFSFRGFAQALDALLKS
jgi:invasion protein IalB